MENWKQIIGKKNHFISDLGRYKIDRKLTEVIKIGTLTSTGYLKINVKYVHRLVAEYFCEKKDGCNIVNHLNGIKTDNRAINLEWTTHVGNNEHAFKTGLNSTIGAIGENHWKAMKIENVYAIYEFKKQGKRPPEISQSMGLNYRTVVNVFNGNNWKHLYKQHFT